jgi:serine phosphatase RsbU (regulator of sigma subunit)
MNVGLTAGFNLKADLPLGEEYSEERLIALMKASQRASAASLQHAIVSAVSEFTAFHFHDDVTLVGLKVTGTREPA